MTVSGEGTKFKPPFIQIDFQITGRCNARCVFCKCWENLYYKDEDLPAQAWIEAAKRIKGFTTVDFLCIGGGEPLLYKDIFEVVGGLHKLGIHTVVVTNGSLFSFENCKKILDAGIDHIDFSIDDFSENHNKMRGIPSLFEKSIDAIFLLKKIKPEISLGISTVICEKNINNIPGLLEWALKELPVDAMNFQAYNQVVTYAGKDWWRNDPLWPKNKDTIVRVMDYLAARSQEGARISNHPLQFEKFKNYFLNPENNLGIKCPAGTFNFSISYKGDVVGCIAEGVAGNIRNADPLSIYEEKFPSVREKAAACKENCHFLINCYFPLHWKRWKELVSDMVTQGEAEVVQKTDPDARHRDMRSADKPGRVILPPEIRDIASTTIEGYPALIKLKEHKQLDVIGKYSDPDNRKLPHPCPADIPYIYLCGDNSESHRWGVDFDENDFFKQTDKLRELSANKQVYHTVVGVRRTNFYKLQKIYSLIMRIRDQHTGEFPGFEIMPLHDIGGRLHRHLEEINKKTRQEGIEFRITDASLDGLLKNMENNSHSPSFEEKEFLTALGAVCKDVFTGPPYMLLDLAGRCNLDCVYCRRFSPWNRKYWKGQHPELSGFLDFEVVENVLTEAKKMGTETVLLVGGGEPTLHPRFLEIINLIKELNMTFNFSTNGVLIDLYNKYLTDGRCGGITVSLSFASGRSFKMIRPESNLKVMRRIESNVRHLANLKRERRVSKPCIIALYAICKYNYKEIVKMVGHAKKSGANQIWYQLVHLEDFSRERLYMSEENMGEVKKLLKRAKELCGKIGMGFHSFIEFEIEHYDTEKGDWSKEGLLCQGCFVGWHFAFVHLRREVFMCCGAKTVGILDRKGSGLRELWFSGTYRRYRNDGLIMHRENPLTLYGSPLYDAYCNSCDNHDQNTMMINMLKRYQLEQFVER